MPQSAERILQYRAITGPIRNPKRFFSQASVFDFSKQGVMAIGNETGRAGALYKAFQRPFMFLSGAFLFCVH